MAVDQLRNLNFYREMLSTSNNYNNNNNDINNPMINHIIGGGNNLMMYNNNNSNVTYSFPPMNGDSFLLNPCYKLNDVVVAGKLLPPVKDDSGVTLNNSLVALPLSRKRVREPVVLPAAMVSGGISVDVSKESNGFSFLGEDLSLQIMQQQLELNRLVSQHMEKIKIEMEERKKQQLRRITAAIENAISKKMNEKDEEISKLLKINSELEEKTKTLHLQTQIWRNIAHTSEATANTLRCNLEEVLHQNDAVRDLADDAVSCCGSGGEEEDDGGERRVGNDGEKWIYRGKKVEGEDGEIRKRCKNCDEGESTVLVLPCRHLCLCRLCGPRVNACPICDSVKNGSIHIILP